ncbi:MAG: PHP domain-containing protein [Clostridiales bacterium]|nr:PHP domain-containing protein [Clostridiales bacterium]
MEEFNADTVAPGDLIAQLNAPAKDERLGALRALRSLADSGGIEIPAPDGNVNNHIHTTFSFSPYSPSKAVFQACMSRLSAVGIIDHDSVGGILEFREAGRIMGIPTTAGFELRAGFWDTPFSGRRLNNPDQVSVAYMTVHGLADARLAAAEAFLRPVNEARAERNMGMCAKLSEVTGIGLDYERDVVPLSQKAFGGSVTERHILCALSLKMIERYGKGQALLDRLSGYPGISADAAGKLRETDGTLFLYDLIGVLKAGLIEAFYIPAGEAECPDIRELIKFAEDADAILAYAYLGDIENSVTGDKKAQAFEDSCLEELFDVLYGLGIRAISYMPARNTRGQLVRVRSLCESYGMLQISGEDINSPRQPFISEASKDPFFGNLKETTAMLIRHEEGIDGAAG